MQAHRWWEEPEPPEGTHWTTLEHAGVIFPPDYEPHGLPVYYEGEAIRLTPEQEEMATLYAREIRSRSVHSNTEVQFQNASTSCYP